MDAVIAPNQPFEAKRGLARFAGLAKPRSPGSSENSASSGWNNPFVQGFAYIQRRLSGL